MPLTPEELRRLAEQPSTVPGAPGTTTPPSTAPGTTTPVSTPPATTTPLSTPPPPTLPQSTPPPQTTPQSTPPATTTPQSVAPPATVAPSTPPPTVAPGVPPASPAAPPSPGTTSPAGLGHGGGTSSAHWESPSSAPETPAAPRDRPDTDDAKDDISPALDLNALRAERDRDNAVTLRASDAYRAQWLGKVEGVLATLRTPTAQAAAYGAALFEELSTYFRELIGHEPWATTAMGKVLRVDRTSKTCRVRIAADDLNPAAVPSERKVSYGAGVPTVGKTYPVHFPMRVTRDPSFLDVEPDPEHLPWLKAPTEPMHWLYYEQWSFVPLLARLWRTPWPVTVASPTAGELCCTLPVTLTLGTGYPVVANFDGLIGYHTGTRTVYLAATPWDSLTLTDAGMFPSDRTTWLMRVADWGFGPAVAVDQTAFSTIDAVLDDAATEPTQVVLSGTDFVTTDVTWTDTDGTGPTPTTPATTIRVRASRDAGASWETAASYEYVRAVKYHEPPTAITFTSNPGRWPFITQPWQRNTAGWAKRTGFATVADTVLGPAGTRVQLIPRFVENPPLLDGSPHWQLNDLMLAAYYPATRTYTPLSIAFPHQVWGNPLDNSIFNNVQICQAEDGTFVVYALMATGPSNVEQYQVFVGDPPTITAPTALYRGQGRLDALVWTQIGNTWTSGFAPFTSDLGVWNAPISPWIILSASADGASLLAYTIGTLAEDDPDNHQLIGSDDYGDTWAALPGGWQPTDLQGSPAFRPMYFVDIPDDDPRAAPVGA